MATVGLSVKLCKQIADKATVPFRQANAIKAIQEDDQLYRLFCATICSTEELDTALKLNPLWTHKYVAHLTLTYCGAQFKLDFEGRPCPVENYKEHKIGLSDEPCEDPKHEAVRQRFLELYKPYKRALADEEELKSTLEQVFEECPNLNRTLEVLPSIGNWIDSTTRERLSRKLEPRAKRRTAEEIKNSVLTPEALAAMARARTLDPDQS